MRYTLRLMGVKQLILLFLIPVVVGAYFLGNLLIQFLLPDSDSILATLIAWTIRGSISTVFFLIGMVYLTMQGVKPSAFPPHILRFLEDENGESSTSED